MASTHWTPYTQEDDGDDTDYGSDFSPEEEALVEKLIVRAALQEKEPAQISDIEDFDFSNASTTGVQKSSRRRLDKGWGIQYPILPTSIPSTDSLDLSPTTTTPTDSNYYSTTTTNTSRTRDSDPNYIENFLAANEQESENKKSPLERFRSNKNKQALSVTDLVTPAWCELQFFYQLRSGRRKKATPAMKQGTKIHRALEEQVVTPVVVATTTRQDEWGLRIWNVIQGLKTLRETGMTRELEVWGVIGGQVVNGVIDELSYTCPDEDLEYDLSLQVGEMYAPPPPVMDKNQKTISEFFQSQSSSVHGKSLSDALKSRHNTTQEEVQETDTRKIYITDIKTRNSNSLPPDSQIRGTKIQLMLYHHLVSKLSTNSVDFPLVASRYNLDIETPFSDSFIAEMAGVQDLVQDPSESSQENETEYEDPLPILLAHNNLSLLWSLMTTEYALTFPQGKTSLGNVLHVEYRTPSLVSGGGKILGSKTFPMSEMVLEAYVEYQMRWWRGERKAVGVVVGEAFKCRYCEFAEGCEWRREMVGERGRRKVAKVDAKVEVVVDDSGGKEKDDVEVPKAAPKKRGRPRKVVSSESESEEVASKITRKVKAKTKTKPEAKLDPEAEWAQAQQDMLVAEAEEDAGDEVTEHAESKGSRRKK